MCLQNDEEALKFLCDAIDKAGYDTKQVAIALDIASSEWYKNGEYLMPKRNTAVSSDGMIEYISYLADKYPIVSVEDGLGEEDWDNWKELTKRLGNKIQLVGDDLFVTNTKRLLKGIDLNVGNSILVKVNQIGTLTEAMDAIEKAHKAGFTAVVSHRSGETEDTTIADIAVAVNAGQIKTGAPCRTERVCKYNRLLRIEEELAYSSEYGGSINKYLK